MNFKDKIMSEIEPLSPSLICACPNEGSTTPPLMKCMAA